MIGKSWIFAVYSSSGHKRLQVGRVLRKNFRFGGRTELRCVCGISRRVSRTGIFRPDVARVIGVNYVDTFIVKRKGSRRFKDQCFSFELIFFVV